MQISETKDNYWVVENDTGHIDFDLNIGRAYYYKKRSGFFKGQITRLRCGNGILMVKIFPD